MNDFSKINTVLGQSLDFRKHKSFRQVLEWNFSHLFPGRNSFELTNTPIWLDVLCTDCVRYYHNSIGQKIHNIFVKPWKEFRYRLNKSRDYLSFDNYFSISSNVKRIYWSIFNKKLGTIVRGSFDYNISWFDFSNFRFDRPLGYTSVEDRQITEHYHSDQLCVECWFMEHFLQEHKLIDEIDFKKNTCGEEFVLHFINSKIPEYFFVTKENKGEGRWFYEAMAHCYSSKPYKEWDEELEKMKGLFECEPIDHTEQF